MSVCAGPEGGWGKDDLQGLQAEQQEYAQLQVTKLKHCQGITDPRLECSQQRN